MLDLQGATWPAPVRALISVFSGHRVGGPEWLLGHLAATTGGGECFTGFAVWIAMDRSRGLPRGRADRPHAARLAEERGVVQHVLSPGAPPVPGGADVPPAGAGGADRRGRAGGEGVAGGVRVGRGRRGRWPGRRARPSRQSSGWSWHGSMVGPPAAGHTPGFKELGSGVPHWRASSHLHTC